MPKATHKKKQAETEQSGGRPFWSGTLTFGLVSVPVNLFPAVRRNRAPLRMIGPDGEPLSRRYFSPDSGKELVQDRMVRGFEIEQEKFVVVTDEELERLAPEKSRDIDLRRFVPKEEIPPLLFERPYFLVPEGGSDKAYRLLAETMEESGLAGIATFVMRGKEYLVAITAANGILTAETLRFPDEIRTPKAIGLPEKAKVSARSLHRFESIVKKHSKPHFSSAKLKDPETEKLLKLIEKKRARGKDLVEVEQPLAEERKVVDLMEVLKRSLSGKKKSGRRSAA